MPLASRARRACTSDPRGDQGDAYEPGHADGDGSADERGYRWPFCGYDVVHGHGETCKREREDDGDAQRVRHDARGWADHLL